MRKPTKHALGLKPKAIICKSWDKDNESQPPEEHFEWFSTTTAQMSQFDEMTGWAEKNVANQSDTLHLTVEVLDTETMRLGRSHIVPNDNHHLRVALKAAQADPESLLAAPLSSNTAINDLVDVIGRLGADDIEVIEDRKIEYLLGDVASFAYVKDGGSRVRGSAFIGFDVEVGEAQAWVAEQPQPNTAFLEEVLHTGTDEMHMRMLFERNINDHDLDDDKLREEVQACADAWRNRVDVGRVDVGTATGPNPGPTGDPRDVEPANAWLLLGDEASYPAAEELLSDAAHGRVGIF